MIQWLWKTIQETDRLTPSGQGQWCSCSAIVEECDEQ
jgi:hypothetical protein